MTPELAMVVLWRHLINSAKGLVNEYSSCPEERRMMNEGGQDLLKPKAEGGGGFFPEEQEALNYLLKERDELKEAFAVTYDVVDQLNRSALDIEVGQSVLGKYLSLRDRLKKEASGEETT